MEQKELLEFIHFFTHNRSLTRTQKHKRDMLLARDYVNKGLTAISFQKEMANNNINILHDPFSIVSFLHQFTESKSLALKYTSHFWDKDPSTGDYPYKNFREFKKAYMDILTNEDGRPLQKTNRLCNHLWQIIQNFLVNDEAIFPWSEFKLKIGYNKYLEQWMNENPNHQPASMPISMFPEDIQPKTLIKGKTLVYFSDVIDVFKQCIEFRDNDLYFTILKIFKESPDHIIDMNLLKTLRGRNLYTDTEMVRDALSIIAHNIFQRSGFPELKINCHLMDIDGREAIRLKILQVGSYSYRNINDSKITACSGDGDIGRIVTKLRNLCDFSVESIFRILMFYIISTALV